MSQQMLLFKVSSFLSENFSTVGAVAMLLVGYWQVRSRSRKLVPRHSVKKAIANALAGTPLSLHPEFDAAKCVGCGTCTRACPEHNVIQLINHRPMLVEPSHCVGHGECEASCPNGAIRLVFGTKTRGMDIPRITKHYETNIPGLYIAGELGGMGLIRNAIRQGCMAAEHALQNLPGGPAEVDLLVVGAGPAGIAAALTAIEKKKSYMCIEQGSFGGTVYNFPRQKIVMSHPAQLPLGALMKFPANKVSKEELLAFWENLRRKASLKIQENVKFETLEKTSTGTFNVRTSRGIIVARKVILAMGVRGSPRKLGLPNEDLPKVAYNLIDPEQYQQNHIAVVGGGNAAVEAAQYLARPQYKNRVILLVRGSSMDTCNEENKTIINRLASEGRVEILYNTSVKEIHSHSLVLGHKEREPRTVANDYLFVFAGAEMPHKFLMSLGIQIDKKFGEALGAAS